MLQDAGTKHYFRKKAHGLLCFCIVAVLNEQIISTVAMKTVISIVQYQHLVQHEEQCFFWRNEAQTSGSESFAGPAVANYTKAFLSRISPLQ